MLILFYGGAEEREYRNDKLINSRLIRKADNSIEEHGSVPALPFSLTPHPTTLSCVNFTVGSMYRVRIKDKMP